MYDACVRARCIVMLLNVRTCLQILISSCSLFACVVLIVAVAK